MKDLLRAGMHWRLGLLGLFVVGLAVALGLQPPIAQPLAYHDFADQRRLLGIPHFFDVTSNLPFLLVGIWGTLHCRRQRPEIAATAWQVLFGGVALVSVGSAYYHWAPTNATLVWDRLPMTIGFMGLFVAMLCEYLEPQLEKPLLWPLVLLGFFSVFYWQWTDDLRLYIWVQAAPLLAILVLLLAFPRPYSHIGFLHLSLVSYILAKVFEHYDKAIFGATGRLTSGHTIKHLLAALGVFWLVLWLRRRQPIERG